MEEVGQQAAEDDGEDVAARGQEPQRRVEPAQPQAAPHRFAHQPHVLHTDVQPTQINRTQRPENGTQSFLFVSFATTGLCNFIQRR